MIYKYISLNAFEHITLHDCIIDEVRMGKEKVKLMFEHIDVLLSHPLNYFSKPKRTGKAALIFQKCTLLKYFLSEASNDDEEKVINMSYEELNKLAKNMEILRVIIDTSIENMFQYKFIGLNYDGEGVQFVLKFEELIICWNRFEGDAWFAN